MPPNGKIRNHLVTNLYYDRRVYQTTRKENFKRSTIDKSYIFIYQIWQSDFAQNRTHAVIRRFTKHVDSLQLQAATVVKNYDLRRLNFAARSDVYRFRMSDRILFSLVSFQSIHFVLLVCCRRITIDTWRNYWNVCRHS